MISLTSEREEQTAGLLCQPKNNNVLIPLPEESCKVSKCFSHSVRACKVLEETEEKTGSANLMKLCFVHTGRWVQPQINDLFTKHVTLCGLHLHSLFGARLGQIKGGF